MILVASQRGGSQQLALHLLNDENEHVSVHEMRGFVSDNVQGALQEIYATSRATQCKKFLLSVSLNPPENAPVPVHVFERTADRIEEELGLKNQPRCIIFHEKQGRRHAHCVWSRIDGIEMKAIKLPYFKKRLNGIAKDLFLEHGWTLPEGFKNTQNRNPSNFTLAEWQQGKRHGLNAKDIKTTLQECWSISDSKASFTHALSEAGYFLARGDRRGYVAVDWHGEVYSLSRALGVKTKDIKNRLGDHQNLPKVAVIHAKITTEKNTLHKRLTQELSLKQKAERQPYRTQKSQMVKAQRTERAALTAFHQKRHCEERQTRQAKIRKGFIGIWDFVTGASRKQKQSNEVMALACNKRDSKETETLITKHLAQRQKPQHSIKEIETKHQTEKQHLNASFVQSASGLSINKGELKQDFNEVAPDNQPEQKPDPSQEPSL